MPSISTTKDVEKSKPKKKKKKVKKAKKKAKKGKKEKQLVSQSKEANIDE